MNPSFPNGYDAFSSSGVLVYAAGNGWEFRRTLVTAGADGTHLSARFVHRRLPQAQSSAGSRMCGRGGAVSDGPPGEVTELLRAWRAGDEEAYARVSTILYDELRSRAARYMRAQRAGESLQAMALVHEAFIRLHDARKVDWDDRNHSVWSNPTQASQLHLA
jgi:ECF sigma factor